jgi:dihydropteroate synthase
VFAFLEERVAYAVESGIPEERICVDPGIGFGKTPDQNLELVRRLDSLVALGRPVVVGLSRKSTLARVLGDPDGRVGSLSASLAAAVASFERGAWMIRAHDVLETVEALAVAAAVERGKVTI